MGTAGVETGPRFCSCGRCTHCRGSCWSLTVCLQRSQQQLQWSHEPLAVGYQCKVALACQTPSQPHLPAGYASAWPALLPESKLYVRITARPRFACINTYRKYSVVCATFLRSAALSSFFCSVPGESAGLDL